MHNLVIQFLDVWKFSLLLNKETPLKSIWERTLIFPLLKITVTEAKKVIFIVFKHHILDFYQVWGIMNTSVMAVVEFHNASVENSMIFTSKWLTHTKHFLLVKICDTPAMIGASLQTHTRRKDRQMWKSKELFRRIDFKN